PPARLAARAQQPRRRSGAVAPPASVRAERHVHRRERSLSPPFDAPEAPARLLVRAYRPVRAAADVSDRSVDSPTGASPWPAEVDVAARTDQRPTVGSGEGRAGRRLLGEIRPRSCRLPPLDARRGQAAPGQAGRRGRRPVAGAQPSLRPKGPLEGGRWRGD